MGGGIGIAPNFEKAAGKKSAASRFLETTQKELERRCTSTQGHKKETSTAETDDPVAGLGFQTRVNRAFLFNGDPKRPKIFLNILENKIDLKMIKKPKK